MSITIYEIAKKAGVSSSTVARALRGDVKELQQRSAEKARHIRKIAEELGYRPNARARALSRGSTHGIGLLYTDEAWIFDGLNTQVVNSLVRTFQVKGYHLVFVPIDESKSWEDILLGGQIDGGVLFQGLPGNVKEALQGKKLPLALLGDDSDPTVSQVLVDDYAGAYGATQHLIDLGHHQIMFLVHDTIMPHRSVNDRQKGYWQAMVDAGLEPCEYIRATQEAIDLFVKDKVGPTAVLCYSDTESTLLVQAMWQHRISIPQDLSIVGFNDTFATQNMTPPLTTVAFDAVKIGELGAQLVLDEIESSEVTQEPKKLIVQSELIVRESTTKPRKA